MDNKEKEQSVTFNMRKQNNNVNFIGLSFLQKNKTIDISKKNMIPKLEIFSI